MNGDQKKHLKVKRILKIVGIIIVLGGLALVITGIADLVTSEGFPSLFWCLILGLPALGIGGMICLTAFRREIATYTAHETAPAVNEMSKAIQPGIQTAAKAARSGFEPSICPACSAENDAGAKFCKSCGAALSKACPACGAANDADAKFCNSCGGRL